MVDDACHRTTIFASGSPHRGAVQEMHPGAAQAMHHAPQAVENEHRSNSAEGTQKNVDDENLGACGQEKDMRLAGFSTFAQDEAHTRICCADHELQSALREFLYQAPEG